MSRAAELLLGAALACAAAAAAAEWTPVGQPDEIYAAYADAASIRRAGEVVTMHGLYDFRRRDFTPQGHGLLSTAVLREYDCAARRVRLLSSVDFAGHMGEGGAVSNSALRGRWEDVVEGGIDEAFWKFACVPAR